MTFPQKSYIEYYKIEKPAWVTTSYEGSNEEEEFETVLIINNHNNMNMNIVSDSNSDDSYDDIENNDKNLFDKDINDQVKETPQTTNNAIVVWVMKKLHASYNNNANKIIKQATKGKSANKNLNIF